MDEESEDGKIFVSLDGFGTRGYSELLMLESLLHRIQMRENLDELPRPCERIDLIGGSGMGGVIALLLGRLRMTVIEALRAYERLVNETSSAVSTKGLMYRYQTLDKATEIFDQVFRDICSSAGYSADSLMEEDGTGENDANKCRTVLFTLNWDTDDIQPIRSYRVRPEPNRPFTILQAARATVASWQLFRAIFIEPYPERLGFKGSFSNPTKFVLEEAGLLFPESTSVACVLSLGVGVKRLDAESIHKEVASRYRDTGIYYRLNADVEGGRSNVAFEEWEDLENVKFSVDYYLADNFMDKTLRSICQAMTSRIGGPLLRDIIRVSTLASLFPPPPPLSSHFVGRSELVTTILAYHLSSEPKKVQGHFITLLYGLGGIGKTQLAIKIWSEFQNRKSQTTVFFLDARSKVNLETGLQTLIQSRDPRFWNKNHKHALKWLATTTTNWFIILDNADNPDMDLSEYIPNGIGNHVLITSRNPEKKILAPYSSYQVDNLDVVDSVELLLAAAQCDDTELNRGLATEITSELHHHPLAISQAGGYILKHGRIADYVSIFRRKREQLLSKKHLEQPNYIHTVYTSIRLSFDQLPPTTQHLLRIFAFLDVSRISEELIVRAASSSFMQLDEDRMMYFPAYKEEMEREAKVLLSLLCPSGEWDLYDFDQLISPALQSSLLYVTRVTDMTDDTGKIGTNVYRMHAHVQSYLQDTVSTAAEKDVLTRLTIRLVASNIKSDQYRQSMATIAGEKRLLPHLQALAFFIGPNTRVLPLDGSSMARVLLHGGLYKAAQIVLRFALDQARNYTKESPHGNDKEIDTDKKSDAEEDRIDDGGKKPGKRYYMYMTNLMATISYKMKRFAAAEQIDEQNLEIRKTTLGEEHPSTLTSMSNVATSLMSRGKHAQAVAMQHRVLESRIRVLGENHPDTIDSMSNLALALANQGDQGDYAEAVQLQKRALELSKIQHGGEHPTTTTIMNNLAMTLSNQGDYSAAIELHKRVLDSWKKNLGEEHPDMLTSMNNLATNLSYAGKHDEAIQLHRQVLAVRKRILEKDHPDIFTSMNNLSLALSQQGQHDESAQIQQEVLENGIEALGEEHPEVLASRSNLALTLSHNGEYEKAIEMYRNILEIRRRVLGQEHPDTLISMNDLALAMMNRIQDQSRAQDQDDEGGDQSQGQLQQELDYVDIEMLLEECLQKGRKSLGEEHPHTIAFCKNLANLYRRMGDEIRADEILITYGIPLDI